MGLLIVITPESDGDAGEVVLVVGERRFVGNPRGGGSFLIDYDDEVLKDAPSARLSAPESSIEFEPSEFQELVAGGERAFAAPEGLARVIALPSTSRPPALVYPGRLGPEKVEDLCEPGLGTLPGSGDPMRANAISERKRVSYLAPNTSLSPTTDDAVFGFIYELETTWEPLGWALEEWISTITLAPGVDVAESALTIQSDALLSSTDRLSESDEYSGDTESRSAVVENTASHASQRGRSTGLTAGLGQQTSSGVGLKLDPVAALAETVTGAVQLGFSTTNQSGEVQAAAEMNRQVSDSIQQNAKRARQQQLEDLSRAHNGYADGRTLRAYANGFKGSTQNLALFSVVRQWLVTTTQARRRHVVFVRAHDVDVAFREEDVFLYRDLLQEVVTDRSVAADIDAVAAGFRADYQTVDPQAWGTETKVLSAKVEGRITDRGRGHGSKIVVRFRFASDPTVATAEPSSSSDEILERLQPFENRTLGDLRGWSITFDNPGIVRDHEAVLDATTVAFELQDGQRTATESVQLGRLNLRANIPKEFVRSNHVPMSGEDTASHDLDRRARRLLTHLNAFKERYRVAIDLVADPATRLARLDAGVASQVADPRPIGVAGIHLAFLTTRGDAPSADFGLDQQLVATPAGGTYLEQWPGHERPGASPDDRPTVVLPNESSITWPDAKGLEYLTRGTLPSTSAKDAPTTPKTPEAGLTASLTQVVAAAGALKDALDAAREKLKDTIPTVPEGEAPETGGSPVTGDEETDDESG